MKTISILEEIRRGSTTSSIAWQRIPEAISLLEREHAALVASEKCLRRICSLSKLNALPTSS